MGERETKNDTVILKAPFWSAGRMYAWDGDPIGFGVKKEILMTNGLLTVKTGGKKYIIDKEKARELVKFYKSFYMTNPHGSKLAVIPKFAFNEA